ncbi:carbohydrate ABC transporter permease [Streptomyces sp. ASQP_92]|uniref:carbohydrate ABC transporter permease n=1 Tax=unclassified Streptomyces TaxID=2593676 RepID=UPI0021C1D8AB|nr:carbohydrate ABC transporter permease [Streptomyces sp. ASQP_92]MCT9090673.1 carbohydrate ABC transporter permease [Streptomyces sp. ASQP_92]
MTTETMQVDGEQSSAPAASAARWKWRSSEGGVLNAFSHVFLLVWALMVGVPLLWALWSSFKTSGDILTHPWALPTEFHFENWSRAWSKANIGQYFLNTAFVVGVSTAGTMLLGSMAAYVLARFEFPGNRFIYFLFVGGMAFPVVMVLVPLFFVTKNLGILNTLPGLILIYIAYSLPFTVFFMTAFFRTLPTTVAEAALIDGASHTRTFFQIMLPMAKPGIISIGIFNVLGQWNQYLLPLVLNQGDTKNWVLTQGLADLAVQQGYQGDWGALFAGLSIAMLPVLAVYIVFQKQVQAGLTAGAIK